MDKSKVDPSKKWTQLIAAEKAPYLEKASLKPIRTKKVKTLKKDRSAFSFFMSAYLKRIREQCPDMHYHQCLSKSGKAWREMTDLEKAPYLALSLEDK